MVGRQDLFQESMQLGHSAAWDQDWERAIEFYRKALAEFPEEPDALSSLGLALYETDRPKEALAVYNQAAKADPNNPVPTEKCAEIFEQLGQNEDALNQRQEAADRYMRRKEADKAIENWVEVARLSPGNLQIRSKLAITFERMGRRNEAINEYLAVASIMQHSGKTEAAIEATQRALSIVPGEPEASKYLRLLRQGDPLPPPHPPVSSTRPLRRKVEEESSDDPFSEDGQEEAEPPLADPEQIASENALALLAGLLFDEPAPEENGNEPKSAGVSAIARGLTRRGDKDAVGRPSMFRYLSSGIELQIQGQRSNAAREFQRALESGLDHPALHYLVGIELKNEGAAEQAIPHLSEARNHPDLSLGANLALGRIYKNAGDMSEAASYLVQALRIADTLSVGESQGAELNQLYDSIISSQEEVDEEELTKVVESSLEFLTGPEWLSRIRQAREQLQDQENSTVVVPIAEMLAVGGSEKVVQAVSRIDNLMSLGLHATAMEEAMLALVHAPTFLGLHRRMAEILLKDGRIEPGLDKLGVIAETHKIRGEPQQAVEVYGRMLRISPVNVKARKKLIRLLMQQDQMDDAVAQYIELGEIYRQMAQIDQAREILDEALQMTQRGVDPTLTLRILNQLGDIDLSRLDWHRALDSYERILQIEPGDESARLHVIDLNLRLAREQEAGEELDHYLQYLIEHGEAPKALEVLEEMVREHPGRQILHRKLAEAYRAAGRDADAIAQYDALGEIQLDAGQVDETIQTIQTIIDMNPPDIEGYQELLRNLHAGQ